MKILEQYRWVQGFHLNAMDILFGGQTLAWVDEDATMLAYEACKPGARLVTAGYDRCSFRGPGHQGDRLRFHYSIVHLGHKSITILAKVYTRPLWKEKEDVHREFPIFEGLVTMASFLGPIEEWLLEDLALDPQDKNYQLVEKLRKERTSL